MLRYVLPVLMMSAIAKPAQAQWRIQDLDPFNRQGGLNQSLRDFDQARLRQMSRDPRPGRDYTKIYLANNTGRTIWVAVLYWPLDPGNLSTLKSTGGDGWAQRQWYQIEPGGRVHVANTPNSTIYTYARDAGGREWKGGTASVHRAVALANNRTVTVPFQAFHFVGPPESYTVNFR